MRRITAGLAGALLVGTSAAVAATIAPMPAAAAPTELLFSEYTEGSGFNKAVEIYNGTGAAVDLSAGGYTLELYSNGSATASQTVALSGSVVTGDVFVVSRADADSALVATADQLAPAVVNFNGDDAVALRKGGALIDVIGQIGVDPGAEWGTGETSTADNTIRRRSTVEAGDTNGADAFDPSVQWLGFPNGTFDGFGRPGEGGAPPEPPVVRPIGEVQGPVTDTTDGATFESPLEGQTVVVQAVVTQKTLARSSSGALQNGFFLQDTAATADDEPTTSDGIFVFLGTFTTLLRADGGPAYLPQVGDELVLRGTVTEFFALTQLSSPRLIEVASTGHDPDADVVVTSAEPPADLADANRYWERHEGERLRVPAGALATSGRDVFPSTADSEVWLIHPDDPLAARTDPFARRVFRDPHPLDNQDPPLFDDGNGNRIMLGSIGVKAQSGDSFQLLPPARLFDTLTDDVVGGLYFSFEKYGIQAEAAAFTPGVDPSTNAPPAAARRNEEVAVASYNVENLYDFRDDPTDGCDFNGPGNGGCPGVAGPFDYVPASDAVYRQRLVDFADQIATDLHAPDILLTQEGEDQDICRLPSATSTELVCGSVAGPSGDGDGKPDTLQDLALAIEAAGGGRYEAASDRDGADARGIVSGFLYRTDRVSLVAAAAGDPVLGAMPGVQYRTPGLAYNADVANPKVLNAPLPADVDRSTGVDGSNVYTRAPQVARFRVEARPSSGSGGDAFELWAVSNHFSSGPDGRVGQRTEQAAYGAAIVDAIETGYPNARVIYGGDLNVFPRPDDPFAPGDPLYPSDQLAALYDQGLLNLGDDLVAALPSAAYSYTFQGQAQTLDQLFVNDTLHADLVQARIAHVNAGWPADHDGDGPRGLSDHDPNVVRFDARAHLSVDDVSVVEGNSGRRPATFTVRVSRPLAAATNVCIVPVPLTASASSDFDFALPCARLAAGATSVQLSVQVRGDRARERNEQFGVLAVAGGGVTLTDPVAFATITNDD
jgi:predicted extracellular nuclease